MLPSKTVPSGMSNRAHRARVKLGMAVNSTSHKTITLLKAFRGVCVCVQVWVNVFKSVARLRVNHLEQGSQPSSCCGPFIKFLMLW